jgi:hypothetical protein
MATLIGEQPNPQYVMSRHPISAQRAAPTQKPPNDSVDMDSWESSACYPRRTFYPLSDGPPHVGPPDHYEYLNRALKLIE